MTHYNLATLRDFIPYARAELSRSRWWWRILGGLLFSIGFAGCALLTLVAMTDARAMARDRETIVIVGAVLLVLAVLPGAILLRQGFKKFDTHPLIRALAGEVHRIAEVRYAYQHSVEGDPFLIGMVELVMLNPFTQKRLETGPVYKFSLPAGFERKELIVSGETA